MKEFFLPFKGVFCRVQPIAFDGTLSFLELLNKLQHYVNKLNENINAVADDLEALTDFVNEQITEIYAYIDTGLAGKQDVLTWDNLPTAGSENPVYSKGIKTYVDGAIDDLTTYIDGEIDDIHTALNGKQDTLTFDSVPTDGSTNPVESNGIYDALAGKQNNLTFDSTPTEDSTNPVYSGGIKTYVDNKTSDVDKQKIVGILTYSNGVWSCDITAAQIAAYASQDRIIMIHPANREFVLYYAGYQSSLGHYFFGGKGTMYVNALNEWTAQFN